MMPPTGSCESHPRDGVDGRAQVLRHPPFPAAKVVVSYDARCRHDDDDDVWPVGYTRTDGGPCLCRTVL